MWIENGTRPQTRVRKTISAQKAMISVIWSANGIKSITLLPQSERFTKQFFVDIEYLATLVFFWKHMPQRLGTGVILHLDNARPHLADEQMLELGVTRMSHPPYSPDLAPSDFLICIFENMSWRPKFHVGRRSVDICKGNPPNHLSGDVSWSVSWVGWSTSEMYWIWWRVRRITQE